MKVVDMARFMNRPSEPRFKVGDMVWICPSNKDEGWYNGFVKHVLPFNQPLQSGEAPNTNLYILEIPTGIDPYFTMESSGRVHAFPHCGRNTTMAEEHDCVRNIESEIRGIEIEIARIKRHWKRGAYTKERAKVMVKAHREKIDQLKEEMKNGEK